MGKYGKDNAMGNDSFISSALRGGSGESNEIVKRKIDRPEQSIATSFALDNVGKMYSMPNGADQSSIKDQSFPGGTSNLGHSLKGASAVNEEVGAAGKVKHVIIPNH